ncbi:MAG: 50S ribosomal protein L4 [Candidatus Aenigmatarchaeota archaeon]|nr:MAG: 50S ribosomal protein L4 [Candidatus Aenigmarchaeota archaeon]
MADVHGLDGKKTGTIELPKVFQTPYRPDLIARAVLAYQSARRQAYGTDPKAGMRSSAHYHGYRKFRPEVVMMNREMARLPRIHGDAPAHLGMRARLVSGAVGGRTVHGPRSARIWTQKLNVRERIAAIRSAIAATTRADLVAARRHAYTGSVPLVVADDIQNVKKTKELVKTLLALGLEKEIERTSEKRVRAGRGKMRGRRYKVRKGPLLVVSKDGGIVKAAAGVLGMDVAHVRGLNAELLAPGTQSGRLTIWSKSAVEEIGKKYA